MSSYGSMRGFYLRVCVLPAAVMAVLGIAIVAYLQMSRHSAGATRAVLAVGAAAAVLVLVAAAYGAKAATRRTREQISALRSVSGRGQENLERLTDRVLRGERPAPRSPEPMRNGESDPFNLAVRDMERDQHAAEQAVLQVAAAQGPGTSESDQRVEVFVNLARRMQSLVHREIQMLDDLEAQVEDPELLKGLFTVDHLATRLRRQSESLAVLGGAPSRRQWKRPVTMHEVMRAAVAEVEQYSRVKVVPPVEGSLQGGAVADIIHLTAELIENATKFSAPHTQVLLRAQAVTSGLAVEVEDRGLGILADDRQRMNALLADPGRINISELLRDGRIGLFVVASLARRHGIKVQVQSNIYGGTQAVFVIPKTLMEGGPWVAATPGYSEQAYPETLHATRPDHTPVAAPPVTASSPEPSRRPEPSRTPELSRPPEPPRAPDLSRTPEYSRTPELSRPPEPHRAPEPSRPPLPIRSAAHIPATEVGSGMETMASAPPAPGGSLQRPSVPGERPLLPKRQAQAHLAPQLREGPGSRPNSPSPEHDPGLMAAFQQGVNRAEHEDRPAETHNTP
ncbi:MAG TPA: ATP-binding protein [Streptosporangiaceae bacterium]|nr:ATP-binding protein [Streptosporangiaceae bacterium]